MRRSVTLPTSTTSRSQVSRLTSWSSSSASARMVACHRGKVREAQTSHGAIRVSGGTPQAFAEVLAGLPVAHRSTDSCKTARSEGLELQRRLGGDLRVLRKDPGARRERTKGEGRSSIPSWGARLHEPLRTMASGRRCSGATLGLHTRWQLVRSRSTARICANRQWVTRARRPR